MGNGRHFSWHASWMSEGAVFPSFEADRFEHVFTKLRALGLVEFEKILMMDIDLLVTSNIDDLFQMRAPAAMKRGTNLGFRMSRRLVVRSVCVWLYALLDGEGGLICLVCLGNSLRSEP